MATLEVLDLNEQTSCTVARAWTLQEDVLAQRKLYVGSCQFACECSAGRQDEAGRWTMQVRFGLFKASIYRYSYEKNPLRKRFQKLCLHLRLPTQTTIPWLHIEFDRRSANKSLLSAWRGTGITRKVIPLQTAPESNRRRHHSCYDLWRDLLSNYTSRSLTCESDSLPAIGGLAREIHRLIGDE